MTYRATRCTACDVPDLDYRAAITAPFVAARVFQRPPSVCRIAQCSNCGLVFFEDRFEDQETARLYADYRSEAYYRERHHWEPWYTRAFNSGLGGAEEMLIRREIYARTVNAHAQGAAIESVLDYGGDRGQLMLGGPGQNHFVFDISGVEPESGVIGLNAASFADRKFDLVLLCEVLEHVAEPLHVLQDVLGHVRPGGLLYITVPNREFPFADIPAGAWYRAYLRQLLKSRWATMAVDFWSTGFKVKFRRVPPLGFAKLHEHINFFDDASLTVMLRRAGLDVLMCAPSRDGSGLGALCRKPAAVITPVL
ncbi:MAG TPA: class I SAM-dependent methyltransferase [Acidocella sp.]|nr:class I SAM-dependent methyltransferase [Acidocella sp.]